MPTHDRRRIRLPARRLAARALRDAFGAAALGLLLVADSSNAYRPFDSTDAAVVEDRVVELEVQPVGYLRDGHADTLVTPAVVANVGVGKGWEIVVQGRNTVALDERADELSDLELVDTGLFLKGVLRDGSLQHEPGPSIATELGVLLPTTNEGSAGVTLVAIASQRWDAASLHVNVAPILTRQGHFELFAGSILEGPHSWVVRPVAELFIETPFDRATTISGLLGAIWKATYDLSLDVAVRRGSEEGEPITEVRAGFTWEFSISGLACG